MAYPQAAIDFLRVVTLAAIDAGCKFPLMVGCEGALESGYGHSALCHDGFNIFGMKAHQHLDHPEWGTVSIPTKEFLGGQWKQVSALWMQYPDYTACLKDRMDTLVRLAPHYPHYAAALAAKTPQEYVEQVSQTWSTDPGRAAKVEWIYNQFPDLMGALRVNG